MADTWEFVSSYEDVEFLGGSNTQDVLVTGIRTKPHSIYIEVRVPTKTFREVGPQIVNAAALSMSTIFETLARQPYVAGVQWGQEAHNGQLQDVAIITVGSTSGNSDVSLTVPVVQLGPKLDAPQIKRLHDQLDELERL